MASRCIGYNKLMAKLLVFWGVGSMIARFHMIQRAEKQLSSPFAFIKPMAKANMPEHEGQKQSKSEKVTTIGR